MTVKICMFLLLLINLFGHNNAADSQLRIKQWDQICELSYDEDEWKQQLQINVKQSDSARQTFKTSSKSLLRKIIQYSNSQGRQNEEKQFKQYINQVIPELKTYTTYFKIGLFIIGAIIVYQIIKLISQLFRTKFQKIEWKKIQIINKIAKNILIVCIILCISISIVGYREGEKLQKTMASLVCRLYQGPKNVIRGLQGPQSNGFKAYINQIQKYLYKFTLNFASIKYLLSKQHVIKQMITVGHKVVLQSNSTKEQKTFWEQMNGTIKSLQLIHSKLFDIKSALKVSNKTLEMSRQMLILVQYGLKGLKYYSQQYLSFSTLINIIKYIIKWWYGFVFIASIIFLFVVFSKHQDKYRPFMKYYLTIVVMISLSIAMVNSFIIPGIVWLNPVVDYISQNQANIRDQFWQMKPDILQILTKIIPKEEKGLSSIYQGHLMNSITQFREIVRPFHSFSNDYLENIFQKGISLVNDTKSINSKLLQFYIKRYLIKQIGVKLKATKGEIAQILSMNKQDGELAIIKPSAIGNHLRQIYDVIRVPLFNRFFNSRWISGYIGILFLLALVCFIFVEDIKRLVQFREKESFSSQIQERSQQVQLQGVTSDRLN